MQFKESLEIILRDCRFLPDEVALHRLLPGIDKFIPPLTAIHFSDREAPRFVWGFPVVHGRRLLWSLCHFLVREQLKCLKDPEYRENLRALTPGELKSESYFRNLSECLLQTLAEGGFLKLDSVLWIYLADVICRLLNQDEAIDTVLRETDPDEYAKVERSDSDMSRLRYDDPARFAETRAKLIRSVFARNDFANSCMKDVFDEVPNNFLNREMVANRLPYTERPEQVYRALDVQQAFLVKRYNLATSDFHGINRILRFVIAGILERAKSDRRLALDTYFLKNFVRDEYWTKAQVLPSQGPGIMNRRSPTARELQEAEKREKLAMFLSLQREPAQYLLDHVPLQEKEYLRPLGKTNQVSREILKAVRYRASASVLEGLYTQVIDDLLRWDFFQSLKSRLRWVTRSGSNFVCDGRPLDRSTISLNLASHYEIYSRTRHGTALFIDLVGFTNRTKALTRDLQEAGSRGDKERFALSSISLAIQRVFAVRNHLEHFGGIPQGFEGDAILDMFPRAIDALRYVSAFSDNYHKNQSIRFRPFENAVPNPFHEGFRVGMASGEYSVISIQGRSNDLIGERSQDRAVGHTINRASRLNSGKKGQNIFLSEEQQVADDEPDPLGILKVRINKEQELHNEGIASFEDTYRAIRESVTEEPLAWYEPPIREGSAIANKIPDFRAYRFEFIFEDPRINRICLIRRLTRRPILKGLEDEKVTVYEYHLFEREAYIAFRDRDAKLPQRKPVASAVPPSPSPSVKDEETVALPAERTALSRDKGVDWTEMVDESSVPLGNTGLSIHDIDQGRFAMERAMQRHLEEATEGKADGGDQATRELARAPDEVARDRSVLDMNVSPLSSEPRSLEGDESADFVLEHDFEVSSAVDRDANALFSESLRQKRDEDFELEVDQDFRTSITKAGESLADTEDSPPPAYVDRDTDNDIVIQSQVKEEPLEWADGAELWSAPELPSPDSPQESSPEPLGSSIAFSSGLSVSRSGPDFRIRLDWRGPVDTLPVDSGEGWHEKSSAEDETPTTHVLEEATPDEVALIDALFRPTSQTSAPINGPPAFRDDVGGCLVWSGRRDDDEKCSVAIGSKRGRQVDFIMEMGVESLPTGPWELDGVLRRFLTSRGSRDAGSARAACGQPEDLLSHVRPIAPQHLDRLERLLATRQPDPSAPPPRDRR